MKQKLISKIYMRGWIKIIGSLLGEILILTIAIFYTNAELFSRIISGSLFSIVAIIYFIQGCHIITSGIKPLYKYIEISKISYDELEKEFLNSIKINNVYIGTTHIFSNNEIGIIILPINDIQNLTIKHYGENYAKGRIGYYYLYIKAKNIKEYTRIYSINKFNLEKIIQILKNKNNAIIVDD